MSSVPSSSSAPRPPPSSSPSLASLLQHYLRNEASDNRNEAWIEGLALRYEQGDRSPSPQQERAEVVLTERLRRRLTHLHLAARLGLTLESAQLSRLATCHLRYGWRRPTPDDLREVMAANSPFRALPWSAMLTEGRTALPYHGPARWLLELCRGAIADGRHSDPPLDYETLVDETLTRRVERDMALWDGLL